jgi:hypothetical protein
MVDQVAPCGHAVDWIDAQFCVFCLRKIGDDAELRARKLETELDAHRARMVRVRELLNDLEGQDTDHVAPCPAAHSEAYRCRCDLAERKELFKLVRGLP